MIDGDVRVEIRSAGKGGGGGGVRPWGGGFLLVPALAMKVQVGWYLIPTTGNSFGWIFLFLRIDNFWIYLVVGGWVMAVAGSVGQAAVDIDDDYGAVGRVARG